MNIQERFLYSVRNLTHRKLRTALTVLGIIVGITSIIILISLAGGLRESIMSKLSSFDPTLISITPVQMGAGSNGMASMMKQGKLYEKDYNSIRQVTGVNVVSKMLSQHVSVKYKNQLISATVYCIEPELYSQTTSFNVETGRFLEDGENEGVVLGGRVPESFDKDVQVNSYIEINEKRYRVVGILEKTGDTLSNLDTIIFMDFGEGKRMFSEYFLPNEISSIQVKVGSDFDMDEVREDINQVMLRNHKVSEDEKDFGIMDSKTVNEQVNSVIDIISLFLSVVAAISILVGMIGISNTMFMAVLERTKEIGVLKSIGASSKEIIYLFVIEAGLLGLIGGILGLIVALLFNFSLSLFSINTYIPIEWLIGSIIFSFIIGVLAGLIPAKNASEIPAIEALRYE